MPHVPSAPVAVRPVASRAGRKAFVDLPYTLYRDSRYWVPPLRHDVKKTLSPKKNAFFEHGRMQLFLAEDADGTVVGRVAAIVNGMHLRTYDDATGFFGFFECVHRYEVAEALLDAAARWLRGQGLARMRGPANPSLNDTAGLLVDGFDREPALLMPYNPPYYEEFLTTYGFERAMTMWAYYVHKKYVRIDKLRRGVALLHRRYPSLALRPLDMDRFEEEVQAVRRIYNDAWSDNWGFVPITNAELEQLASDLKQILEPGLVFFLEDEGQPVAFSITLPDLNQALRHIKDGRLLPLGLPKLLAYTTFGGVQQCRMPLMGVVKSHQKRGLYAPLVLATIEEGPRLGYDACEMSWVLDANRVLRNALDDLGGVIDKEYAMFEMEMKGDE